MPQAIFIDWQSKQWSPDSQESITTGTLFDLPDLEKFDLLFFDPLQFALANDLRENDSELWMAEYISLTEPELVSFLSKIRQAANDIRHFLDGGGIWILRSNIPNSHIKIHKQSKIGAKRYTESVISTFFWLEEFLGSYSIQYGADYALRFQGLRNHLYKVFGDSPVESLESPVITHNENIQVIAESARFPFHPVIYRINRQPRPGEIYTIPKFLVKDEEQQLIKAFDAILNDSINGPKQPAWLNRYEQKLLTINPYSNELTQTEKDIGLLEQQRVELYRKRDRIAEYAGLLYATDEELTQLVRRAFNLIGFAMPDQPEPILRAEFDIYLRDNTSHPIAGKIVATGEKPLDYSSFQDLLDKIESLEKGGGEKPIPILISNGPYKKHPAKRFTSFEKKIIQTNLTKKICLISTVTLFEIVCLILEHAFSPHVDHIKEMIRADIGSCTGQFETNLRKYLAAATIKTSDVEKRRAKKTGQKDSQAIEEKKKKNEKNKREKINSPA